MPKQNLTIHAYISGKVQGVFYRDSCRREAKKLALTGWVKNLPDGRVEVLACGDEQHIHHLIAWLKKGPLLATVDKVDWNEIDNQNFADFVILH